MIIILPVIAKEVFVMDRTFPETLSVLRKERNISQRTAAAALHISQALLSH